jgi:heat shock protein HslJ
MPLSMRWLVRDYAVCVVLLVFLVSSPANATADGPDHYQVVDVGVNNALNIRASPRTNGAVIGTIPYDADGIVNFGCIGGLTVTEYEAASATERAAARKTRWCRVGYDRTIGWVAGWFLAEGGSVDSFRGGPTLGGLAGTEWQVRDFASKSTKVEVWIAFKADGTVVGHGGCNQFNGSYIETARSLSISSFAATMMACPTPKMSVETNLFKALDDAREIVATHLVLALFDDTRTLLATLTRRDWD